MIIKIYAPGSLHKLLKLEVTAAGTPVAVLIKVISLESLHEGVERNDGYNYVISVGVNDDNKIDKDEAENHLLHILQVDDKQFVCSNSWGNVDDMINVPQSHIKNIWSVRTAVFTE